MASKVIDALGDLLTAVARAGAMSGHPGMEMEIKQRAKKVEMEYRREIEERDKKFLALTEKRLEDRKELFRGHMANGEVAWMLTQAWEVIGDEGMTRIFERCPRLSSMDGS